MKTIVAAAMLAAWLWPAAMVATAQTASPDAKSGTAPAGNSDSGKQLFAGKNCASCHGNQGQGSGGVPRIGPPGLTYSDFRQDVRQPTGKMPPVTPQMASDAELTDIYTFLKTMAPAAGQTSFSAAAGNVEHGKKIYTSYGCYQCHGYEGQGSTQTAAARIGPPAISLQSFASYIRQPAGVMPPYTSKVVTDQDVADIYTFLQSIPTPPPAKSIPLLNQ